MSDRIASPPDLSAVIDSGIWISALQFGRIPLAALKATAARHRIVSCAQIRSEIHRILCGKFRWTSYEVDDALQIYLESALIVSVPGLLTVGCRDPKDNMVLECALLGRASVIVSGDNDLLDENPFRGIPILKARDYCENMLGLTEEDLQSLGSL